ncbi:MAG: fumarate hydratase [Deltaproteobacteria bacterium]|nr:fumarate hydratase [Deltaproteobacteria bacterium]
MRDEKRIETATARCLIKAGTVFREDQFQAYKDAIETVQNPHVKWVLERILENAYMAKKKGLPLCDDTGIPHVLLEVGKNAKLAPGWLKAVHEGIISGLRAMPGRPMAVKGDDVERVQQSKGLFDDPGRVAPAPLIIKPIAGNCLRITILLLGGGPEIRAMTHRIFHKRSIEIVLREAAGWMASQVKQLGCTPCVLAIGIGRTHAEASALMLEAMKNGTLNRQNYWEKKVTEWINNKGVGPLALGGDTTALGTFINTGALRASGVRIVSVRPCCCMEPRRATVVLNE